MPERTKKRRINTEHEGVIVWHILRGPKETETDLLAAAERFGYEIAESIPWREAFSEYSDDELPGVVLLGARTKEGLTQVQLANKINVTQGHISDMECGKRSIGKNMAKTLGQALNVNYKVFL
jgi:DNA-binding XRE family transcriptional regulator